MRRSGVFVLAVWMASRCEAGLWFRPAPAPSGADVHALLASGADVWAASSRGVFRLSAGEWTRDGLGDRPVTSLAVSDGSLWAATGEQVLRRMADGTYLPETLPSSTALPGHLLADGSALYAGGLGVYRRASGAWTALPSPGAGLVTAMTLDSGALVVGLSTGGAARFTGSSFTPLSGGIGPGESPGALASFGGTLYAGTVRGLYSWTGAGWARDATFGEHDVRALAASGGVLRAATSDARVLRRSGSSWVPDGSGVLPRAASAFGAAGSDLYLGTSGGPVYRLSGASWVEAGPGLSGATVSDVVTGSFTDRGNGDVWVGTRGAGVSLHQHIPPGSARPQFTAPPLPAGCGDVVGLGLVPNGNLLAATVCGPFAAALGGSFVAAGDGLPAGVSLTTLDTTSQGVVAGTASAGVFRFSGSSWSADANGLPSNASISAIRQAGTRVLASLGSAVWQRGATGAWSNVSAGLPGVPVFSLAGDASVLYAGLSGGVSRSGGTRFHDDSAGIQSASVLSLELSAGRVYAGAGERGLVRRDQGGWLPETFGLPPGVDVRVVRDGSFDPAAAGVLRRGVFAGTAGHGLFFAPTTSSVRTLPVVLDVLGAAGAHFRSELTVGSRAATPVNVRLTFQPAAGFPGSGAGGTAATTLAPGTELRAPDALQLLRSLGVAIPEATSASPVAGSLTIAAEPAGDTAGAASDDVYAIARTYTADAQGGSYGVFYGAPSELEAAEDTGAVYGLRAASGVSRSNLALVHLPGRGSAPITLRVDVYAENGVFAGSLTKDLAPGEWHQFNGVLGMAGLPDGAFGYARITRVAGSGAWSAYGVVNDGRTSDGSLLPLFRPGGLAAARRLVVPVVLDVYGAAGSHFTSELTLVNDSAIATPVDLVYRPAPGFGSSTGVPVVTIQMAPRQQLTIPDIVQFLRDRGVGIPDPREGGAQAGTLSVTFRLLTNLDGPSTVALARTSTPNPDTEAGGSFGLFYPAVAAGGGAATTAVVPALSQNATVRSNLAVVHLGGGSELSMTLSLRLHDAASGRAVGNPLSVTLFPGDWYQWSRVLEVAGALGETSSAVAIVTRVSGDDSFFAYGVLNDNVTSDGSFLPMIAVDRP